MATVTWTQDANSNYEISSAEHLKQLMHKGTLYTEAGSPPTDYWAAGTNYIQTVDIDLLGISTDILPIGKVSDRFYGIYDGGNFTISNWSYVDPRFTSALDCEFYVGMFGAIQATSLRNIRLGGIWTLEGFHNSAGFLVGYSQAGLSIENIECDFAEGTFMESNDSGLISTGAIGGLLTADNITGWTVRGSVEFRTTVQDPGGLAGALTVNVMSSLLRNLATFPSGISGTNAGGVSGKLTLSGGATFSKYINAMTGDISGGGNVGGVVGECSLASTASGEKLINAMTGNITSTNTSTSRGVGGIFGETSTFGVHSNLLNYMTGDIVSPTDLNAGGLVGHYDNRTDSELNSSINAMNGNVPNAIVGNINDDRSGFFSFSNLHASTSFGLTFTTNTYGNDPVPSGMLTTSEFPDLPYVLLDGADTIGNVYDFNFVYANLAGNVSFSTTHLLISQGQSIFQDGAVSSPLFLEPRPTSIIVSITEISGSSGYNITYEGLTGGEIISVSGTSELDHSITGLEPDTAYTVRLYANMGSGYTLEEELTTTTLPNIATSYDKQDYDEGGFFNLRSLASSALSAISSVWNGIFGTGDIVGVSVPKSSNFKGSFINLGDTLSIKEVNGVVLPFESANGTGQDVIVTLSDDATDVPITYDETVNTITVDGAVYSTGESFILDGKKVTILNV